MDDEENRKRLDQPGLEADEATDQQALVPTAVRQVNFHGDVITVVLVEERGRRQVYVLLRPLCQYLGLSWSSQLQRLREDDVLSEATTSVLLSNTEVGHRQRYTMIGLQLEFLPGWMFSFTRHSCPRRFAGEDQTISTGLLSCPLGSIPAGRIVSGRTDGSVGQRG